MKEPSNTNLLIFGVASLIIFSVQFLSEDAKEERKLMSWRRVLPPYEGEKEADTKYLGMALTPHVRESWRADSKLGCDCPDTAPSSSSSSSDASDTSDDDASDSDSE